MRSLRPRSIPQSTEGLCRLPTEPEWNEIPEGRGSYEWGTASCTSANRRIRSVDGPPPSATSACAGARTLRRLITTDHIPPARSSHLNGGANCAIAAYRPGLTVRRGPRHHKVMVQGIIATYASDLMSPTSRVASPDEPDGERRAFDADERYRDEGVPWSDPERTPGGAARATGPQGDPFSWAARGHGRGASGFTPFQPDRLGSCPANSSRGSAETLGLDDGAIDCRGVLPRPRNRPLHTSAQRRRARCRSCYGSTLDRAATSRRENPALGPSSCSATERASAAGGNYMIGFKPDDLRSAAMAGVPGGLGREAEEGALERRVRRRSNPARSCGVVRHRVERWGIFGGDKETS